MGTEVYMLLGIDLGTGSIKVILQSDDGTVAATGTAAYPLSVPESGAAETHPDLWIAAFREALDQVRQRIHLEADKILPVDGIGFSGQMHGIVPLSAEGAVLHPAILWADNRGGEFLPYLEQVWAGKKAQLMNAPNAGMTALTLLWLKKYRPQVYRDARWFLFPKDYIRYRLTGLIATDYSDASGSLLYNFKTRSWDAELCGALHIDAEKLPPILESIAKAGLTTKEARGFGLADQVPVAVGSGDTPAALFGTACFIEEPLKKEASLFRNHVIQISVGTAVQVVRPLAFIPAFNPALNYYESALPGQGYHMAAMLNGGLALERVREWLCYDWDEFYREFDKNPWDIPEDLVFLPYLAGERTPYRNPDARGAWIGLGLHHGRRDLMASALLGVAFTVRLGIETLLGDQVPLSKADYQFRLVGGSSRRSTWTSLLASVVEHPLMVSEISDASGRGAAAMARTMLTGSLPEPVPAKKIQPQIIPGLEKRYTLFLLSYSKLYNEARNC